MKAEITGTEKKLLSYTDSTFASLKGGRGRTLIRGNAVNSFPALQ